MFGSCDFFSRGNRKSRSLWQTDSRFPLFHPSWSVSATPRLHVPLLFPLVTVLVTVVHESSVDHVNDNLKHSLVGESSELSQFVFARGSTLGSLVRVSFMVQAIQTVDSNAFRYSL